MKKIVRAVLAAALLAACGGKTEQAKAGGDAGAPAKAEGPPRPAPVTAKKLAPVISEVGPEGAVPTAVVIELAVPIVARETVGETSERSVVEIAPAVAGKLKYTGESTLTFVPARAFAPGQHYRFEL